MRIFIYIVLWVIFLCSFKLAYGQDYIQKNFTIKDGLPSNEVYCSLQDKDGRIWFGTDAGVSVFNGFTFKNYTIQDGLLDNSIFAMHLDKSGKIWFGSLSRRVFYFEDGKFKPALNSRGDTIYIPRREILEIKSNNEGVFYFTSSGSYKITKNNNSYELLMLGANYNNSISFAIEEFDNDEIILSKRNLILNQIDFNIAVNVKDFPNHYHFKYDVKYLNSGFWTLQKTDTTLILTSSKTIIQLFKSGKLEMKLQKDEILKSSYINGIFYTQCRRGGIKPHKLNQLDSSYSMNPLLQNITVTSYFYDSEQGFWATSLENGVYYSTVVSKSIISFESDENYWTVKLDTFQNSVWALNKSGLLVEIESIAVNKPVAKTTLIDDDEIKNANTFVIHNNSIYVSITGQTKVYNYIGDKFVFKKRYNKPFRVISNGLNGNLYASTRDTIYKITNSDCSVYLNRKFNEIFSIYNAGDSLLIGSNEGLHVYKINKLRKYKLSIKSNERIQVISKFKQGCYVLGTKTSGIIIIGLKHNIYLNRANGLISNNITSIISPNDTVIWCASKEGLSKLIMMGEDRFQISNFNTTDGLLHDNIFSIAYKDSLLHFGTSDGYFAIPEKQLSPNVIKPIVRLEKISSLKTGLASNTFDYNNNDIKICISTNSFRNYGKIKARYRINNSDTAFYYLTVKDGEITLLQLEPGNYQLFLEVANNSGLWSDPLIVNFEVLFPWWKKTWFILLSIFVVISLSLLLFSNRVKTITRRNQEKAKLELQLEELKNKALRLQMNPHFLFNALNTIQGYYAVGETSKAKEYIQGLSSLLRQVLEITKDDVVNLERELQMISNYLDLNLIKNEKKFKYEITIDPGLIAHEILVPPLITQPFIENAIVHGISTYNEGGVIKINIYQDGINLVIEVIDNGIGRTASSKMNKDLKKNSMGIQVTKDRIELVSRGILNSVEIKDLYINEDPKGTKVTLRMPLNYDI